jgi:hydrogenase maturation factor
MEIDESSFIYPAEVRMVCEAFSIDPLTAIAEGSLLITSKSGYSSEILYRLKRSGIRASVIGKVLEKTEVRRIKRKDGTVIPLSIPDQDPFWPAFFKGLEVTNI